MKPNLFYFINFASLCVVCIFYFRYSLVWFTPLGVKQEDLWWNFENNETDAISDIL